MEGGFLGLRCCWVSFTVEFIVSGEEHEDFVLDCTPYCYCYCGW